MTFHLAGVLYRELDREIVEFHQTKPANAPANWKPGPPIYYTAVRVEEVNESLHHR